jgi:D-arginine dehydrogenase
LAVRAAAAYRPPRLERTDVLIVGAGLAGASLAWHLAGAGRVLLLEQGPQPLAEASAQNAGMVRRLVRGAEERDLACRSAAQLAADSGRGDWQDLETFRPTGAVIALAGPGDPALAEAAADLAARGLRIDEVPAGRLGAVAPALAGAPLTRAYHLPDEGVCDAWSLGQGFLRGARRHGTRLEFGLRVRALISRSGRVSGVETERGPILAGIVVVAAGAWSQQLAASAGLDRPLRPLARHLLQSTPHPLAAGPHPWCWIDDLGLYLRPEAGGFLCSPCDETERHPAAGPGSAGPADELGKALTLDKLRRAVPALGALRFRGGWTGLRTFAPDRRFRVGFDPELDGLFWLAGLGGAGLTCAFALGEDAAAAIAQRTGRGGQNASASR